MISIPGREVIHLELFTITVSTVSVSLKLHVYGYINLNASMIFLASSTRSKYLEQVAKTHLRNPTCSMLSEIDIS